MRRGFDFLEVRELKLVKVGKLEKSQVFRIIGSNQTMNKDHIKII